MRDHIDVFCTCSHMLLVAHMSWTVHSLLLGLWLTSIGFTGFSISLNLCGLYIMGLCIYAFLSLVTPSGDCVPWPWTVSAPLVGIAPALLPIFCIRVLCVYIYIFVYIYIYIYL